MPFLVLALAVLLGRGGARPAAQHAAAAGPDLTPATHAATAAAKSASAKADPHAKPAASASAPSETAAHGGAPKSAPAAANEPVTRAAAAPDSPGHRAPATSARSTGSKKDSGEGKLGAALTRIQERISTETGPAAKTPSRIASSPNRSGGSAATSPQVPRSTMPLVSLRWRTSLVWPAELHAEALLAPLPPIELQWR